MTDDKDYFTGEQEVLAQEFADLHVAISNALGGDVPADIGDRIDGLFNSVVAYEDQLVERLRELEEEIAALRGRGEEE